MLIFSNTEIEEMITMTSCMEILEEMYRDFAKDAALFMSRVDNLMPTVTKDAYYAFKTMGGGWPRKSVVALRINSDIITHPNIDGHKRRVKKPLAQGRWVGLVQLYSTETGTLLAIFPDGVVQRLRVGATNGLGLKYMAGKDAARAGLIGSGWQAGGQLLALLAVRPIQQVKVFSPTRKHREAFVSEMRDRTGLKIIAVDDAEACAEDVDILMAATSSIERVIEPQWIKPGMHLSCIKSQEVDETVFDRCDRVVMHTKIQGKQTDNILPGTPKIPAAHLQGWWQKEATAPDRYPDLTDLVSGRESGRNDKDEVTCFVNNIGLGLQFAAVGSLILEKARESGIGNELPDEWFTESVHP
ncbi:MAG: ornithine cyclodeaminase family protein [Deltaproteobacteria bacterium]|nr:ornithine cyclodeaminase family protein [Deltaproteobacteria bacterium]